MFQIIRYSSPRNNNPYFELINDEEKLYLRIKNSFELHPKELRCIGYFDGRERHKCPNNAINVRQCPTCKFRDISKIYTRFDFTGYEELEEKREEVDFAIYLTTFGDIVKAGVTERRRLDDRIYEQGGKFYAEIAHFKGKKAYEFESLLHNHFNIKGFMRREEKIEAIKKDDKEGLEKMKELIEMLREKIPEELNENITIKENHFTVPEEFERATSKDIKGEIVGFRGQVFFSKNNGKILAYHGSDFIGFCVDV